MVIRNLALRRAVCGAVLAGGLGPGLALAADPATLSVCMSEDNAPLSVGRKGQLSGFDVRMAEAVAQELGRSLRLVPFESELEQDANFPIEVNALLSAGVCDLVSGFPLLAADLGQPGRLKAKPPDYPGAKRPRDRADVLLGEVVASRPYQGMALQLVQRLDVPAAASLGELRGQKVGAVAGTLEGTLIATFQGGALVPGMVSMGKLDDRWAALESGQVDAMLMPSTAWDDYRKRAAGAPLRLRAGAPISLGINLGWVALAGKPGLIEAVNRVAAREVQLQQWAKDAGLQRLPPTEPAVVRELTLSALMKP
jgi:ABC-type amino acid transport substrate-binding protein